MTKFWAIAANTFIQTIRQPIFLVLLVITFLAMAMLVPQSGWTMGYQGGDFFETDQVFLRELGLATLLVSGLLIAAFAASNVIGREIRDKTALTVVSKPISRLAFVLGKYVGVALAVTVAYYLAMLAFLLVVRHGVMPTASDKADMPVIVLSSLALLLAFAVALGGNYLFGWTFTSATVMLLLATLTLAALTIGFVGKGWQIVPFGTDLRAREPWYPFAGSLAEALVLTFLAVQILVAVAVAASARVGEILTLLICLGIFAAGTIHPFLFGQHADLPAARVLGWLFPKLSYFDKLDAISHDKTIPMAYVAWAGLYAALYIVAALGVGLAVFQTRQIEAGQGSALPGVVSLLTRLGQAAACVVGLVVVPILLSQSASWSLSGLLSAGALLLAAAAGFYLWTLFGRGVAWSWRVLLGLHGLALVRALLVISPMGWAEALAWGAGPARLYFQLTINLTVVILLVLPKTRRHVESRKTSGSGEMQPLPG